MLAALTRAYDCVFALQVYALQCKQMPNGNAFCDSVRAAKIAKARVDVVIHASSSEIIWFLCCVFLSCQDPIDAIAGL